MTRPTKLTLLALASLAALLTLPAAAHDKIKTVVGNGPNNIPALTTGIPYIGQIAVDPGGNVYMLGSSNSGSAAVYKLSHGIVTHIAGDGTYYADNDSYPGESYDGSSGPAIHVELNGLNAIAVDNASPANVFISDSTNCIVLQIDQKNGQIYDLVGGASTAIYETGPSCGFYPQGLAVDPRNDDLYIAQGYGGIIFQPGPGSTTVTHIGGETEDCSAYGYPGEPGICSQFLAVDTSVTPANLYIGLACRVDVVIGATGQVFTVAGSPNTCGSLDNVPATQALFGNISQISVKGNGTTATVQVADFSSIRQFTVSIVNQVPHSGIISTIAGLTGSYNCSFASTAAVGACVAPNGIGDDALGNLYYSDANYSGVRKVVPSGQVSTILAQIESPTVLQNSLAQPGLYQPSAVFADPASSTLYIGGGSNNIWAYNLLTTRISGFAGNGVAGFAGDGSLADGPNTEVTVPSGMAKDRHGNLYFADYGNCRIRVVNALTGIISTFAGGAFIDQSYCGYTGDNGPALDAQFSHPNDVAFDPHGNLVVADTYNCAIRRIDAVTHIVTTIAGGNLTPADCFDSTLFAGDGGPATHAYLSMPFSLSYDAAGNLYIADTGNAAIREVFAASGIIETIAGQGGNPGYNGDPGFDGSGRATQAQLNFPYWVKSDANGNLFLSDMNNNILRWITPAGQIVTFAGEPPALVDDTFLHRGFEGDGGSALNALLYNPQGLDQDIYGNIDFADQGNNRIRQVSAFPGYGLSTTSLTFTSQKAGTDSTAQIITVSAIGPTKFGTVILSHPFTETDNCTHAQLTAGQTCQIHVTFDPKAAGSFSGLMKIYSNALLTPDGTGVYNGNPDEVTLTATAHN